jgi:hypothetical protein
MSYGFEAYNSAGEKVIDAEIPVFSVTTSGTLSGVFYTNSATYGNLYRFTISPNDELIFFHLPNTGDLIYRAPQNLIGANGWLSTQQNLGFFRAKRVSAEAYSPSGYGMVVFDSSGVPTFRADQTTASIEAGILLDFTTTTHASSDTWYCIPNAYQGIFSVSGSTIRYRGTGVYRINGSTIRSVDTDHPDYPPFLVLTANT